MKKLLMVLLLATAACSTRTTVTPVTVGAGASGPRPAVDAFLSAIRAKDLQALGAVWGTKDGAMRDNKRISREELEQRGIVMMCYFNHESYKVIGDAPAAGGERVMAVTLTRGTLSRTTNFYVVSGSERWYVRSVDMDPVRDLCSKR